MATAATLRDTLKERAATTTSESYSNPELDAYINRAMAAHNRTYTVTSLPSVEEYAVVLYAWSLVVLDRANRVASEPSKMLSGSPGTANFEFDTPYRKLMGLFKAIKEQYSEYCASIGVTAAGKVGSIHQGQILARDHQTGAFTHNHLLQVPSAFTLALSSGSAETERIITWDVVNHVAFDEYTIFFIPGANKILHEPWNPVRKAGIPEINSSAYKLATIPDPLRKSGKVVGINRSIDNHFLVVATYNRGRYLYSSQVTLTNNTNNVPNVDFSDPNNSAYFLPVFT